MYSTYNQGKSVIVGRIVRTLNNKTYKYLILISKIAYIDKLHDIVNEYINTYHSTVEWSLLMQSQVNILILV